MTGSTVVNQTPVLPPRYYLENFRVLYSTVQAQYADLLQADELAFIEHYDAMDEESQCLYLRLISRRGPWFRSAKLSYPEIGDLRAPLEHLLACNWLLEAQALELDDVQGLFTLAELRKIFPECAESLPTTAPKSALMAVLDQALSRGELTQADLARRCVAYDETVIVAPSWTEHVALLQLLFFGNRRQDLTEFVLSDLGVMRYVQYPLDRAHRLFPSREAVEEYLLIGECADTYWLWREQRTMLEEEAQRDSLQQLAQLIGTVQVGYEANRPRFHALLNRVARELERMALYDHAMLLYCESHRHPARERNIRVLVAQERWEEALALCETVLAQPWCEDEYDAAGRLQVKARRALFGERAPRTKAPFSERHLNIVRETGSVERDTATALMQQWPQVRYVENALMNSLFGLAYWDVIFSPVAGAFNNPFQSVPADMYAQEFSLRRRKQIAARRDELEELPLVQTLTDTFRRVKGLQNRWVSWGLLDEALIEDVLVCMPKAHLLAIWDRLLFDPGENRRGFPDLIALDPGAARYEMIEVKGPGDALQASQKRWLNFFQSASIPASVLWVQWIDD
ncbi:MAG: VRR-NUC domain-containing protein [Halieaceae bacterium]|nr:VRR-NUC domain-containing protein [Halieaceae bacterium]